MINFKMPKGRQTIRKSGGRHTRLWELAGSSIPAVQRLEVVYLDGHGAMDRTAARHAANKAPLISRRWARVTTGVSWAVCCGYSYRARWATPRRLFRALE